MFGTKIGAWFFRIYGLSVLESRLAYAERDLHPAQDRAMEMGEEADLVPLESWRREAEAAGLATVAVLAAVWVKNKLLASYCQGAAHVQAASSPAGQPYRWK
jgi:hypothetical protein